MTQVADVVDGRDVDFFADFFGFGEVSDELGLIQELGSFAHGIFDFEGNFGMIFLVDGEVDFAESPVSYLFLYQVVV